MSETFGPSRNRLMRHLLRNKSGASIDDMAGAVGVTRTAVRQHLAALMRDGLVAAGQTRPTGGRPEQLFVLSSRGREEFPRRYSWFAQLLLEAMEKEHGTAGLRVRLGRIAAAVVAQIRQSSPATGSRRERVESLATLMSELGYDARTAADLGGAPTIEADNCVFHELATRNPEICHFDLALLSGFSGSKVQLHECMARGGHVCRFQFKPPG
ncbi:MAG TPA: winged helix-turn-helix transcriptional regulator [Steroidobacteraceae bacterium]|jgi:predicted ArsR family transcriptional regulator|nr:winged helix-turn-helix transcriptional regulator [Steroidobacteraceae bacterium]